MRYIHIGLCGLVLTNIALYFFLFEGDWQKNIPYTVVFLAFIGFQYFSIGNPKFGEAIHSEAYYVEHNKTQLNFIAYCIVKQIFVFSVIISLVVVMV